MTRLRLPLSVPLAAFFGLCLVPSAQALDPYSFSIGLQGSIGGSVSDNPDAGLDNFGWQGIFTWQSELRTYVVVRAGQLPLDVDEGGGLYDSDLSWLTISGEYRFTDSAWDSGLFIGLGGYEESADFLGDGSGVGLTIGTTARFPIVDRLDVLLELAGHFTDLERAETFVVGNFGLTYRF